MRNKYTKVVEKLKYQTTVHFINLDNIVSITETDGVYRLNLAGKQGSIQISKKDAEDTTGYYTKE